MATCNVHKSSAVWFLSYVSEQHRPRKWGGEGPAPLQYLWGPSMLLASHGKYHTKTYGFVYMASIQQAYGKARCLLCGMHMVSIWLNHIATTWIPYRRHMDLHSTIILHSHMAAMWYLYFIIYPLCLYGLHMASIWQSNMVHYQMKTTWNSYGIYVVFI